jgi:hypothetical protein
MATTCRTILVFLVAIAVALVLSPTAIAAQPNPRITVTVYNRSKLPDDSLTAGQSVALELLRRAGVESVWIKCPIRSTPAANRECRQPPSPTRLTLTVVPHWVGDHHHPRSHTLGLALEGEQGFGSYCYVFQQRLDELAGATHVHPARLLGHAMAHEIGHLLKGSNSHSPRGLMSEHWYINELRDVSMGSLNFTADDEEVIRTRLAQAVGRE